MSTKVTTEQSESLPKAGWLTVGRFSDWIPASVGRLVAKAWQDGTGKGTHVFVSADGALQLPFVVAGNSRLKDGCDLARYLRRRGLVGPGPDPDVLSVAWLADQPQLADAVGRVKAIELIRLVPGELQRLNPAKAPTGSPPTAGAAKPPGQAPQTPPEGTPQVVTLKGTVARAFHCPFCGTASYAAGKLTQCPHLVCATSARKPKTHLCSSGELADHVGALRGEGRDELTVLSRALSGGNVLFVVGLENGVELNLAYRQEG